MFRRCFFSTNASRLHAVSIHACSATKSTLANEKTGPFFVAVTQREFFFSPKRITTRPILTIQIASVHQYGRALSRYPLRSAAVGPFRRRGLAYFAERQQQERREFAGMSRTERTIVSRRNKESRAYLHEHQTRTDRKLHIVADIAINLTIFFLEVIIRCRC